MLRARLVCLAFTLVGVSFLTAQEGAKVQSGLKVGGFMPGPFECYNVNGSAKGRPQCLVCKFALSPTVMIFAREPAEGKDEAFNDLVKKLDETAEEFTDRNFSVGVVILSPDAKDSANNTQEEKAPELIKEAVDREKLIERLDKRAKDYKHVIVATHLPPGPTKYDLDKDAAVTIVFYERMKIRDKQVFAAEKLEAKDVDAIIKRVHDALPAKRGDDK